jgi:hypothetical protein
MNKLTQEQIRILQKCLWGWGENEGQVDTEFVREISSKIDSILLEKIESVEQNTALEATLEVVSSICESYRGTEYGKIAEIIGDKIVESLAAPAGVPAGAEAWQVSHPDAKSGWKTYEQYPNWAVGDPGLTIRALYAAPSPALASDVARLRALLVPVRDGYDSSMRQCLEDDNEYVAEQWRERRDEIDAALCGNGG